MIKAFFKRFGFVPKKDVDDAIEEYQNREIYSPQSVSVSGPIPPVDDEDDDLGSVNLNDIDPDELLSDKIFEMLVKTIPEGWFVFEAGQSPLHMLWYCQLIDFESMCTTDGDDQDDIDAVDVRRVYSEEKDTLTEALKECIDNIENEQYIYQHKD